MRTVAAAARSASATAHSRIDEGIRHVDEGVHE
jgi:hypothetical protein